MSLQRLYLAVQRLTLPDSYWDTLLSAMRAKGANDHPNASHRNHWRVSLDGTIYIFEAEFDTAVVDLEWFVDWMATQFDIESGEIGASTGYNVYGRFSTFSYPSGVTDRFRMGVFGFIQGAGWPPYTVSHQAVLDYLSANIAEWELPEEEPAGEGLLAMTETVSVPTVSIFGIDVPISSKWTYTKVIQPLVKLFKREK